MDIPPGQEFRTFVSNVSNREVCLEKQINIATTTGSLNVIHVADSDDQKVFLIRTFEVDIYPFNNLQLNEITVTDNVSALSYMRIENQKLQMSRHTLI